jgi:hypothetical protein
MALRRRDARRTGPRYQSAVNGLREEALDDRRLADARVAGDEHQPPLTGQRLLQQPCQMIELSLAPVWRDHRPGQQHRRKTNRKPSRGRGRLRGDVERGILLQHSPLELPQAHGWIDAELVGQHASESLIALERLCVAARSVQSEHQLSSEAFAPRMTTHQSLELRHELTVSGKCKIGLDPILQISHSLFLEPSRLQLGERLFELP